MGVLQGTFDTLSITEVLGLLAQSQKTGALWLEAGSVQGRVYLTKGRCCAAESGDVTGPVEGEHELGSRLVDVCFTLARQPSGSFRFAVDEEPAWPAKHTVDVDEAVEALDALLGEWREIQLVIPSLDTRPALSPALGADSVLVDQALWRLIVSLDGNRTVRDVMRHTERGVLDTCNALKRLVEMGAVEILPETSDTLEPTGDGQAAIDAAEAASMLADVAGSVEPGAEPHDGEDGEEADALAEHAGSEALDAGTDGADAAAEAPGAGEPAAAADPAAAPMPDPFAGAEDEAAMEPYPAGAEEALASEAGADLDGVPLGAGHLEEGDPRDRGALLRLFSALRDT
jgi:Domain of unknown function (DUF4388)